MLTIISEEKILILIKKIVEDFLQKKNIKFHLKDVSEEEKTQMKSLQNWARELRYDFFFKILEEENLIMLLQHTISMMSWKPFSSIFLEVLGIKGLSGIPKNENSILRPLLKFTKAEIYAFAEENHIISEKINPMKK